MTAVDQNEARNGRKRKQQQNRKPRNMMMKKEEQGTDLKNKAKPLKDRKTGNPTFYLLKIMVNQSMAMYMYLYVPIY